MDELIWLLFDIVLIFVSIGLFIVLVKISRFLLNRFKSLNFFKTSRLFNPYEYFPEEEVSTIQQLCYLAIIVLIVVDILYSVFGWSQNLIIFSVFDIILSLHFAIHFKGDSFKNKIILFGLIPLGSLFALIFSVYVLLFDVLHLIILAYYIKVYYDKFVEYTETNSLGITIMLLFLIIFISFFVTIIVEGVSPIDSLNMVSNAFTSNGYTVLGTTGLGKANSILLVWSGFILSCVGTATLTVSIIVSHIDDKFDRLEKLAKNKKK